MLNLIKILSSDKTESIQTGVITAALANNRYLVDINGTSINVPAVSGMELRKNEQVLVASTGAGRFVIGRTTSTKTKNYSEIVVPG